VPLVGQVYGTERATLIQGNCLEALRGMSDASVDAVVTDPPFGVRDDEWDCMSQQEFARFSMAWLSEAKRVGRELISFWSTYGPFRTLCEMLWQRVRVMVWDKPLGSQYAGSSERGLWFAHETILHCYTPEQRQYVTPKGRKVGEAITAARKKAGYSRAGVDIAIRGKKTSLCYRWEEGNCLPTPEQAKELQRILGLDGSFIEDLEAAYKERDRTVAAARQGASDNAARGRDVFSYRTETGGKHPCQKPLPMMVELLERLTPPDATILDPFAGSGTTGVACIQTSRNFVGIEIDPAYCAIAKDRIAKAELTCARQKET
jgi:adenine-specific DNA-methyltransferase